MQPPPAPKLTVEAVYRGHVNYVWRIAWHLGAPEARIEDVVQDVFLVVHRRLAEFRGTASIRTWLYRITALVLRDHRRDASRHARRVEARAQAGSGEPVIDTDPQSDAAVELKKLLARLDERLREVLVAADIVGMTGEEIAVALGENVNTVYARLRTARARLKQMLEPPPARPEVP